MARSFGEWLEAQGVDVFDFGGLAPDQQQAFQRKYLAAGGSQQSLNDFQGRVLPQTRQAQNQATEADRIRAVQYSYPVAVPIEAEPQTETDKREAAAGRVAAGEGKTGDTALAVQSQDFQDHIAQLRQLNVPDAQIDYMIQHPSMLTGPAFEATIQGAQQTQLGVFYGIPQQVLQNRIVTKRMPGVDQYDTIANLVTQPQNWTPEQITDLQQRLQKAGFFTKAQLSMAAGQKAFVQGQWDEATRVAYAQALMEATQGPYGGSTIDELLDARAKAAKQNVDTAAGFAATPFKAPPLTLTDPAEVAQKLNESATTALGRKLRTGELEKYMNVYREFEKRQYGATLEEGQYANDAANQQRRYQYQVQQATALGIAPPPPPTATGAPTVQEYNPQAEAAQAERAASPVEAGGQDLRNAMQGFLDALRQP